MACDTGEPVETLMGSPPMDTRGLRFAGLRRGEDVVLNFLHIPKTGGTSLQSCLASYCRLNRIRCHYTWTRRASQPMYWRGRRVPFANNLDALRNMTTAQRDSFDIVYGHQESDLQTLLSRRVLNVAFLRNPYTRYESEVSYLRRQGFRINQRSGCVPHEEEVEYLWKGSDFRKGEIRSFVPDEDFYAQRRTPGPSELRQRLASRRLARAPAENPNKFDSVADVLSARFPHAASRFVCDTQLNRGSHHVTLNRSLARPYNGLDESLWHACRKTGCRG